MGKTIENKAEWRGVAKRNIDQILPRLHTWRLDLSILHEAECKGMELKE
jgi:hypothetical protein